MMKKMNSLKQCWNEDGRAPKSMTPNFFGFLNEKSLKLVKQKEEEQKQKLLAISLNQGRGAKSQRSEQKDTEESESAADSLHKSEKPVRRPRESIGKLNCQYRIISAEKNIGGVIAGKVHLEYADGERYVGLFENNERIQGKVIFSSGVQYNGGFKNDRYHGNGKVILTNGTIIYGEWKEGEVQPHGRIEYENGDLYVGNMYRYKKDGLGELFMNGKRKRYVGHFKNGEICGWGILYDGNKKPIEGHWQKGVLLPPTFP